MSSARGLEMHESSRTRPIIQVTKQSVYVTEIDDIEAQQYLSAPNVCACSAESKSINNLKELELCLCMPHLKSLRIHIEYIFAFSGEIERTKVPISTYQWGVHEDRS